MVSERFKITLEVTLGIIIIVILIAFLTQYYGEDKLNQQCSYLDPIMIDFLAFIVAIFLIIEGFYKIFKNKQQGYKKQILRIIRIGIGFAILTLHTMQFLHK
jgi:membrane protease YdiL (CAAX protease family)